jgi:hypothetical protein
MPKSVFSSVSDPLCARLFRTLLLCMVVLCFPHTATPIPTHHLTSCGVSYHFSLIAASGSN